MIEIHSEAIIIIPIYSKICIRANLNSSESIRKKFSISFDVLRLKINPRFLFLTKIQSDSIRDFQFKWIRGQNDLNWILNQNNSNLRFITIEKLVWIHSDSKSRIKSDRFSTDLLLKAFFGLTRIRCTWSYQRSLERNLQKINYN